MACSTKGASIGVMAGWLALAPSIASAERAASAGVIKCDGVFSRNASHAGLAKAFGNDNVIDQEIDSAGGKKIKASVLYPDHPKARLEFVWRDEKARRQPTMIRAKDQSGWTTANGIRIGMALADVEKINRKPFKLSGFDWELGGRVTDWQGGALGKRQPGGCTLGVEFVHSEDAPEANLNKVSGDREFRSDNTDLRAVEAYVAAVTISYPSR